jgi:hypothetical protein
MFPLKGNSMRLVKTLALTAAVATVAMTSGCASVRNQAATGSCYFDVVQPLGEATISNVGSSKSGKSTAMAYLGWVAMGDASINAAAKAGGISKIAYVDYHSTNILGIIGSYTTIVYGE